MPVRMWGQSKNSVDQHYRVFAAGLPNSAESEENANEARRSGRVLTSFEQTPLFLVRVLSLILLAFYAAVFYCATHQNNTTVKL
jgi:hypothetical protein